jgi:uncharacterized protein YcbX
MATIQSIYRYPVKGLSPERLQGVVLTPGETVPGDRLYAIENGPSGFDPSAPAHLSKDHFLMLRKNERLAALHTVFDQATHVLRVQDGARESVQGNLRTDKGRAIIERFFAGAFADELNGAPKILHARGHSFSDVAAKVVSIINLASVAALDDVVDAPVNPLRFRGNVYVAGWPAWSELELVGKELRVGPHASLRVVQRILRCAATNVDPMTGIRDLNIPKALMRALGHSDCGVYAEVIAAGEIGAGYEVEII